MPPSGGSTVIRLITHGCSGSSRTLPAPLRGFSLHETRAYVILWGGPHTAVKAIAPLSYCAKVETTVSSRTAFLGDDGKHDSSWLLQYYTMSPSTFRGIVHRRVDHVGAELHAVCNGVIPGSGCRDVRCRLAAHGNACTKKAYVW